MSRVVVSPPAKLNGDGLAREIENALGVPRRSVHVVLSPRATGSGWEVEVHGVPPNANGAVEAAVSAHAGEPTPEERTRQTLIAQVTQVIGELEAAAGDPTGWRSMRADLKDEVLRKAVLGLARVARLLTSKFD